MNNQRQSIRLKNYDYSQSGLYYVTICTQNRVVAPSSRAGIKPSSRAGIKPAPTIGDVIGAFKSLTTHEYIMDVKNNGWKPFEKRLWQRNYYVYPERSRRKHIIRTENDLNKIRQYINTNPQMWERDRNNPIN